MGGQHDVSVRRPLGYVSTRHRGDDVHRWRVGGLEVVLVALADGCRPDGPQRLDQEGARARAAWRAGSSPLHGVVREHGQILKQPVERRRVSDVLRCRFTHECHGGRHGDRDARPDRNLPLHGQAAWGSQGPGARKEVLHGLTGLLGGLKTVDWFLGPYGPCFPDSRSKRRPSPRSPYSGPSLWGCLWWGSCCG